MPFPKAPTHKKFAKAGELKPGQYGVPNARNYAAVDSVVAPPDAKSPLVCFQMSVKDEPKSGKHGYWQQALVQLRKDCKLEEKQELICVLVAPPDKFETVSVQPLWVRDKKGKKKQAEKIPKALKNLRQFKLCIGWKS